MPSTNWNPIEDLPHVERSVSVQLLEEQTQRWEKVCAGLGDRRVDKSYLDIWLLERNRSFAISTGQIEGLYTLKPCITEQLITEGLDGVESSHTTEGVGKVKLLGMLEDQRATLEIVFDMVKHEVPLTHHIICGLHEIVSKHQDAATGIDPFGKRMEIPLRKGQYKLMPNNPRRPDGETHYYCPPEQTQNEMDRLLTMHQEHEKANVDSITEAAWLHHRFVQVHPFQNGNGRIARLLLAYVIAKGNGFPPIVDHGNRNVYINSLEKADQGDLQPFVDFLAVESSSSAAGAISIGENVLKGVNRYIHGNGGVTINDKYHGPGSVEAVRFSFHVPPIKGVTKISASEDKEPDITH